MKASKACADDSQTGTLVRPRMLTVDEVADLFRCSTKTIYRRVAKGELPAIRNGGRFLFTESEILAQFQARMVRPNLAAPKTVFDVIE